MSSPKKKASFKHRLMLLLGSCLFMFALLGVGELYCRWFTRIKLLGNSRDMFVGNRYGGSYGNVPNYEGISFDTKFRTDENGFRVDPNFPDPKSNTAVLIVGDSVSFGPGVEEPETFTGRLRRSKSDLHFYNSSVIGYGVNDYANIVNTIVPQRPEVKYVLLFYCLNDVYNSSAQQINQQVGTNAPLDPNGEGGGGGALRSINDTLRTRSKLYMFVKNALRDTPMSYFKADLPEYQKGQESIDADLRPLEEINGKLSASGIRFKVFVLPYAAQVRAKQEADLLPQKLVGNFLRQRNIDYYDTTRRFMDSGIYWRDLYIYGDPMHFSEDGHRILSEIVNEELAKMMQKP